MPHIRSLFRSCIATAVLLFAGTAATAGDKTHPMDMSPPPGAWQFRITPYAWLTNLNGSMTVRGQNVDVDASFIDVVKESDALFAFMVNSELRKGRLSFYSDVVYAKITASGGATKQSNPIAGLSLSVAGNLGLDFQMFILEGGATYELFRRTRGGSWKDDRALSTFTALDLVVGGRYWNLQSDITFAITGTVNIPALGLQRSGSLAIADGGVVDWFDPLIGIRLRHQFSLGKELFARADVGGFGVGSDISWNVIAGYTWECACKPFGATMNGVVGYRALYADYTQGSGNRRFQWDMLIHGPALGLSFKF